MKSVRERLVASWNKAVADAVLTSQHPKPSVTRTSMPAIPVTPAADTSWRITEKAPPPKPSKRVSFFKGILEQARLAGLTDEEIASIAAALKLVLDKEERSGDTGRSVKRGVLPEACSSQTTKRLKAVLEPSSNPESVSQGKHAAYRVHDHFTQATIDGISNSCYNTDSGNDNRNTNTSCSTTCNPVFWALDGIREQQIGKKRCVC